MVRDIEVQRNVMVPRLASAIEIVAVVGGVATGVLRLCRILVPKLMYL